MKNYSNTKIIKDISSGNDWYSITCDDGMGCGLKKSYGVVPKIGDKLTVHTKGGEFGTIRGMDLNEVTIFWKTDEELEADRLEWLENNEREKQQKFKENKILLDEQYNELPDCFKKRIDRFRANNPRFRIDYESYELFCCTQAVEIANSLKTADKIQGFMKLNWKQQEILVPKLSDGHSGNTFGCACRLAYLYLTNPENVSKLHGSLSPLVGSKDFGDIPINS